MDILTEKGQNTLIFDHKLRKLMEDYFEGIVISNPDNSPADIDGIIISLEKKEVMYVYENKYRPYLSIKNTKLYDHKRNTYYNDYLISDHKIKNGVKASQLFGVPFLICIYLGKGKEFIYFQVTNNKGNIIININYEKRKTQKSVNGGIKNAKIALLSLDDAFI